jgi:broad specificity phosphatase PhoE
MSRYSPPARITFISHPATPEQKAGVFPQDEPLDSRTLEELSAVAWRAPQGAYAVTAPEQRTRQTAAALGLSATEVPELRECDFGLWRGAALDTLYAEYPEGLSAWLGDVSARPHQGESYLGLMERVGGWMESQRDSGHVLAITHASVIRAAVVHALQAPPHHAFRSIELAPLTVTDIRLSGASWRVRSIGVPLAGAVDD